MIWPFVIFIIMFAGYVVFRLTKEKVISPGIGVPAIIVGVVLLILIGQFADFGGTKKKTSYHSSSYSTHKSSGNKSNSSSGNSSGGSSGGSHSSGGSSNSGGGMDSYDNGYEDVYENEDYDQDRYNSDSDYRDGVDDAMDDLDEDW